MQANPRGLPIFQPPIPGYGRVNEIDEYKTLGRAVGMAGAMGAEMKSVMSSLSRFSVFTWFSLAVVSGAEFHVSPTGRADGNGSLASPIDLATALSGKMGQPGDTFWLRDGTYSGHFYSALQGQPGQPITVRQHPGEQAIIEGTISQDSGGYVTYWGFELTRTNLNHTSSQPGSAPTDLPIAMGMNLRAPGLRLINLVIHDHLSNGVGLWSEAPDAEIYGCLFYHNGWDGSDRGHAHGIYAQNKTGYKRLYDNISFQNYSDGIQIYGTSSAYINGFDLQGNVLFNNGIISRWSGGGNLQLGGGVAAQNILVRSNYAYSNPGYKCQINVGSEAANQDLRFEHNTIVGPVRVMNWNQVSFSGNTVAADNTLLELHQLLAPLASLGYAWDQNRYASKELQWRPFGYISSSGSQGLLWSGWRQNTGLDPNSNYVKGRPSGVEVVVRPNAYERGRGHVVVYNWDLQPEVTVNVAAILPLGMRFEVRPAQAYYETPLLSGTYLGQNLALPMSGWSNTIPNGQSATPPATGPEFNVFVIVPLGEAVPPIAPNNVKIRAIASN